MDIKDLDIAIANNTITNIAELTNVLTLSKLDEETVSYLLTLKNKITSMNLNNKKDLENLINAKIIEYSLTLAEVVNNSQVLAMLKQVREDFSTLKIIETNAAKNDSHKYVDYLTFTENGEVQVLVCNDVSSLKSFVSSNLAKSSSLSAKEFFNYYKEYIHADLEFYNQDDFKQELSMRAKSLVNDAEIEKLEYDQVMSYKQKYGITFSIAITIDDNGERLYRLGDGLIKFHTETSNTRVMDILKPPTLEKTNVYNDMLAELEQDQALQTIEASSTNIKITTDSYGSLENIQDSEFQKERLIELLATKNVYDMELSYAEEHELNVLIKYLLELLNKKVLENKPVGFEAELLADIFENNRGEDISLVATYEAIKHNDINDSELSNIEKEFISRYIKLKEEVVKKGLEKNDNKKLELITNTNLNTSSGVTTVVVLLELMILALFIFMFLRLDI